MAGKPVLLVSSCILGQQVRYDGGHKLIPWISTWLGHAIEIESICPEVEMGLGVPRPPVQWESTLKGPQLVEVQSKVNHTDRAKKFNDTLRFRWQTGFVAGALLQSGSPSCGLSQIPLFDKKKSIIENRMGFFADYLSKHSYGFLIESKDLEDPIKCHLFTLYISFLGSLGDCFEIESFSRELEWLSLQARPWLPLVANNIELIKIKFEEKFKHKGIADNELEIAVVGIGKMIQQNMNECQSYDPWAVLKSFLKLPTATNGGSVGKNPLLSFLDACASMKKLNVNQSPILVKYLEPYNQDLLKHFCSLG